MSDISPWPNDALDHERYLTCRVCGPIIGEGHALEDTYASRIWPESQMVEVDGVWYCADHYNLIFPKKYLDEETISIDEQEMRSGN